MPSPESVSDEARRWLAEQVDATTTEFEEVLPSHWSEASRYLPPSATPLPGYYRFEVTPYMREVVDCFGIDSPVREVSMMKGVQICATTALENVIGYVIDHVKTAPVMLLTADAELAKLRVDSYITPMLQSSGLMHLIKSSDELNARKTGKTDAKIEWVGGGFLLPFGAQNASKLRSFSVQYLLRDELDAWPDKVGKDGDPVKLSADRTAAYESSRKVFDISTPLLKGTSKIHKRFLRGDQRYYYVCCLKCGFAQVLRWRHVDPNTGVVSGIVWELDGDRLVPDSVRYLCQSCQHPHTNEDKTRLLSPDHGAEWRPTAEPSSPEHRSYHVSALYSPVGMQTWESCVRKWLEAWDVKTNTARDIGALQVFYNNVLGEPFEVQGDKVRFERVSAHRRSAYHYGEIPNAFALTHCASPILLLTCAVDVHKDNLKVAIFGWARDRRAFLIEYHTLAGETEALDGPVWGALRDLIEDREFVADDGRRYRVMMAFVDSGYNADTVYRFCAEYPSGVFPVKGRSGSTQAASFKEFSTFESPLGTRAYMISVDHYKERWSSALSRQWGGHDLQPDTFFNAPVNASDPQLKELTVETKVKKVDKLTGAVVGWEWRRPGNAANELWDLLVYSNAALEVIALDHCTNELGLDHVDWQLFYADCIDAL